MSDSEGAAGDGLRDLYIEPFRSERHQARSESSYSRTASSYLPPMPTFAINPGIDQLDIIREGGPRGPSPKGRRNWTTCRM